MTHDSNNAPDYAGRSGAHTPGPYKVTRFADGTVGVHAKLDGHWIEIAVLKGRFAEANANLIAAAPDMLEALQIMDAYLYVTAPESNERQIVNRALAIAEGRQS